MRIPKRWLSVLVIFLLSLTGQAFGQADVQINNAVAFTKLYGYLRYFHPTDEARTINWDYLAIYGSQKTANCKTKSELRDSLLTVFKPIAPTLSIHFTDDIVRIDEKQWTPSNTQKYKPVSWQHLGVGLGDIKNIYKSERTNRKSKSKPLFAEQAIPGEFIDKEIGSGLRVVIPIVLYGTEKETFPVADKDKLARLQQNLLYIPDSLLTGKNIYTRLGNLAILWNVFQHFYPYFSIAKTNWDQDLRHALATAYTDTSSKDFVKTIQAITARLKDGHIRAGLLNQYSGAYIPPFDWEWIEGKLVITRILKPLLPLRVGDVVETVNGQTGEAHIAATYPYISAATKGWLTYRAEDESLMGQEKSDMHLVVRHADNSTEKITVQRTDQISRIYREGDLKDSLKMLPDNIIYINIGRLSINGINQILPALQLSKAIICDLRGYPNNNHQFLEYLLKEADTSSQWMRVPKIIYPDQEQIAGYQKHGWFIKPGKIHLQQPVYFLIDGRAISYAESYMSFVENYRLATIIGQPTAGTNGNVNVLRMPGSYFISWTGMLVTKHDGSQHHGIGILPNIYVEKTIRGVRENRDEFIEKALELIGKR